MSKSFAEAAMWEQSFTVMWMGNPEDYHPYDFYWADDHRSARFSVERPDREDYLFTAPGVGFIL